MFFHSASRHRCSIVYKEDWQQVEKSASHLAIPTKSCFFTQRHGTGVALYTKRIGSKWKSQHLTWQFPLNHVFSLIRRNKVYASWRLEKTSFLVNRGSHFQVHFVWQVWDGQLSPATKSIRLKAIGGWKVDRGTTQLHVRILRGKGV